MRDYSTLLWTRRTFLKTSLVGGLILSGCMTWPARTRAAQLPEGRLTWYNLHTDERLAVTYRNDAGHYDHGALDEINFVLRCHYTNEVAAMDVRLIEYVNLVQKKLGDGKEIHVVSGYRSPEYQALLVRTSRRAARHSYHVQGQAIDLQIPGVHPWAVRQAAFKLKCGGVGYYPRSKFVHLDSGPFRTW